MIGNKKLSGLAKLITCAALLVTPRIALPQIVASQLLFQHITGPAKW